MKQRINLSHTLRNCIFR